MGNLSSINHVVVVMLENRSFDCMLGTLKPKSPDFEGLDGTETNPDAAGMPVGVWNRPGSDKATMSIPNPDPGELFTDMNQQLFGVRDVPVPTPTPFMQGFVQNYLAQAATDPSQSYTANHVMHYFTPEQVPVISQLARSFAVCDQWHASAPCQTWPNRFFVHTGTANGYENNDPPHFTYEMDTIFNRLEEKHLPWKIYFHDMPQSLTLTKLWEHLDHFRLYAEFHHDARNGSLPAYSFIEPRYFADTSLPNDQHPPHIVTLGEQLIADVYNSLRSGPDWQSTLLVITYDEHGGCFDHVAPPKATPPGSATAPFNFDRYGVRVPAVIVSPFVPPGLVLRSSTGIPFDHTSIIATLCRRFSLPFLSARDAAAPDLDEALNLPTTTNLGPARVEALPYVPSPAELAAALMAELNDQQRALVNLAAHLPATVATGDFATFIRSYLDHIRAGASGTPTTGISDVSGALALIRSRIANLFSAL
jgi:phospholipase C